MTPAQCKMARAALDLGVRELAEAACVSPDTVARLERGEALKASTLERVQQALEAKGAIFIAENGDGPGVRLRKGPAVSIDAKGPATDAVHAMDAAIEEHKASRLPKPGGPGVKRKGR